MNYRSDFWSEGDTEPPDEEDSGQEKAAAHEDNYRRLTEWHEDYTKIQCNRPMDDCPGNCLQEEQESAGNAKWRS